MLKTKTYSNGLRLIVDKMENYESVSFNMFVKTGSVNEDDSNRGISHFIEHMLFKGTTTRSSLDISKQLDAIGANVNAYTDKEETVYYTKTTADNAEKCVEILSDMLFNSTFDTKEMSREKNVVIEEIKMYDDDAPSKVELLANQAFYDSTPFKFDVAGTISSVKKIKQSQMFDYKNRFYVPSNIVLSFAGNITFEDAEKLVEKYYIPNFKQAGKQVNNKFENSRKIKFVKSFKDNAQSQVCISFDGTSFGDKDVYASKIFDIAFGLGMSSILFQTIREKLGLVYNISSSTISNCAGGDMSIRFATSTKNVPQALLAVAEEIKNVTSAGISEEQFENAKTNLISSIKLSFENTSFVSLFNAKRLAFLNQTLTKQNYVEAVQKVTLQDVKNYIVSHFRSDNYTVSLVGDNTKIKLEKYFKI